MAFFELPCHVRRLSVRSPRTWPQGRPRHRQATPQALASFEAAQGLAWHLWDIAAFLTQLALLRRLVFRRSLPADWLRYFTTGEIWKLPNACSRKPHSSYDKILRKDFKSYMPVFIHLECCFPQGRITPRQKQFFERQLAFVSGMATIAEAKLPKTPVCYPSRSHIWDERTKQRKKFVEH